MLTISRFLHPLLATLLLHAAAFAGTANFDALPEGAAGFTFTHGGLTFTNLDTGTLSPAVFVIEDASATLAGEPGFSPNNALGFASSTAGPTAVYGAFASFVMRSAARHSSVRMQLHSVGLQLASGIRLTARLAGDHVDTWFFLLPLSSTPFSMEIALDAAAFDEIEVGAGAPGSGETLFAFIDDIVVSGGPDAAGVGFCAGDGTFTDHTSVCPCGNTGAPGNGCANSVDAGGANLTATGDASRDDVVLRSSHMPATSFQTFLQHAGNGDLTFHDGVLCASGTIVRLRGRSSVAGAARFPDSSFALDATTTLSQRGGVVPGQGVRRNYSVWYRNAASTFCPPASANVTNGWRIDW